MSAPGRMATSFADAFTLLTRGRITLRGRMPYSSNATFLAELDLDGAAGLAVYKPVRGEQPLWDFPPGLFKRELAAYLLSEALGWGLVPPTVRREGPYGEGSLQLFVSADFEQHYFTLRENPAHHECLKRICVFDLVANNADRKAGHCLLASDGAIYAVDNGLCFHVEPKLRTVIWDFGDEPIPEGLLDALRRFLASPLSDALAAWLAPAEGEALRRRAHALVTDGRFPTDASGVRYPWPLV
jgi:uncharacterized repeat protein (TIGR03843 family)